MSRAFESSLKSDVNIHSTHALLARSKTEVKASSFSERYNKHEGNESSDRQRQTKTDKDKDVLVKILLFRAPTSWIPPAPFLKRSEHKQVPSIFFFSPCGSRSETSGFIGPDFSRLTLQRCGAQVTNSLSSRKGQSDVFHMLASLMGSFRRCDVKYGARTGCEHRKRK